MLSTIHVAPHLFLTITTLGGVIIYVHCTDEETEAPRRKASCPRPPANKWPSKAWTLHLWTPILFPGGSSSASGGICYCGVWRWAGIFTSLGILRGLAVWAGVLDLGHILRGSCWERILPRQSLKGGWAALRQRYGPRREHSGSTPTPPPLLSGAWGRTLGVEVEKCPQPSG